MKHRLKTSRINRIDGIVQRYWVRSDRPPASRRVDFPRGPGLSYHAVVYVPTTLRDKTVSSGDVKKRIRETEKTLRELFGGTTRVSGVGTWKDDKGKTIAEKVIKVESFSKPADYKRKDLVLKSWLVKKKKKWRQDSLSFELNDSLHLLG